MYLARYRYSMIIIYTYGTNYILQHLQAVSYTETTRVLLSTVFVWYDSAMIISLYRYYVKLLPSINNCYLIY